MKRQGSGRFVAMPGRRGKRSAWERSCGTRAACGHARPRTGRRRPAPAPRGPRISAAAAPAADSAVTDRALPAHHVPALDEQRRRVLEDHRERRKRPRGHEIVRQQPFRPGFGASGHDPHVRQPGHLDRPLEVARVAALAVDERDRGLGQRRGQCESRPARSRSQIGDPRALPARRAAREPSASPRRAGGSLPPRHAPSSRPSDPPPAAAGSAPAARRRAAERPRRDVSRETL